MPGPSCWEQDALGQSAGFQGWVWLARSTPSALEELPCPVRVPHDLKAGDKIALWFSAPFSRWHVGKITEVNKRRTVSENVTASFYDAPEGDTVASFIATAEEYGLAAGKN